ncbi:septal ring lytic transglycosylase RlpA family protein [Nitrincola tapanii]|uniref:Endolytic peptidoglycan transglycosylase RlpA n=1 Tax=Nitrincola tapanii TaxID=1708751 RepID=A0A5A9W7M2_9GAMM|nr:septal ring lytic transglycosylase RlpA family protein [Nitrincola tapanii]KAA0876533.1 septal ring lytic transglycosylase RlpA family protein [Nitrincola tapanii]
MRVLFIFLSVAFLLLSGCATQPPSVSDGGTKPPASSGGRYAMKHDRYPVNPPDVSKIPDAEPRFEPYSRGGNRSPYEVFGQTYYVLPTAVGYREKGMASWYGEKFHGHHTSNGEVYDMYTMTAAHKSLPLPTFARVTNLDNGRSVIVRVNDRGPFHEDRIIDLSYAAAHRLDILREGTGRVEVEALTPGRWTEAIAQSGAQAGAASANIPAQRVEPAAAPVVTRDNRYLQVGAFSVEATARQVQTRLVSLSEGLPVGVYQVNPSERPLYRVKIGPLQAGQSLEGLISRLAAAGFHSPHLVDMP